MKVEYDVELPEKAKILARGMVAKELEKFINSEHTSAVYSFDSKSETDSFRTAMGRYLRGKYKDCGVICFLRNEKVVLVKDKEN